ncbi:DinB family protein [Flagellimonas meishanensis]|uniref:DinB family protein n=1 Tax=Flagellimonas meishanensis TaxID=2873264 RepID=UPI001CA734A5|nr:hypothetical protein [[Muricauda] meishanensis]
MKNLFLPKKIGLVFFLTFILNTHAQDMKLPYYQIPDYPEDYGPGNVVARMIDALGFRYYWATEGLTQKDLEYTPAEEARTCMQTLEHIHGMSEMILNAADGTPNIREENTVKLSFDELRKKTLENIKSASGKMRGKQAEDFEQSQVIFKNGDNESIFPYWNMINGMLSDCMYHTGQIVLMRRMTGNPKNPNVSVFMGRLRE